MLQSTVAFSGIASMVACSELSMGGHRVVTLALDRLLIVSFDDRFHVPLSPPLLCHAICKAKEMYWVYILLSL